MSCHADLYTIDGYMSDWIKNESVNIKWFRLSVAKFTNDYNNNKKKQQTNKKNTLWHYGQVSLNNEESESCLSWMWNTLVLVLLFIPTKYESNPLKNKDFVCVEVLRPS